MAGEIKYEILEEIGVLSESVKGWKKELNIISWNGAAPKYDLRDWSPGHEKMGKGITLTAEEISVLSKILLGGAGLLTFSSITDSIIGHDVIIENYCKINKFNINANEYIKANSNLGDTNDSNSRAGQSGQKL